MSFKTPISTKTNLELALRKSVKLNTKHFSRLLISNNRFSVSTRSIDTLTFLTLDHLFIKLHYHSNSC